MRRSAGLVPAAAAGEEGERHEEACKRGRFGDAGDKLRDVGGAEFGLACSQEPGAEGLGLAVGRVDEEVVALVDDPVVIEVAVGPAGEASGEAAVEESESSAFKTPSRLRSP
jgi:hypothetical protein